MQKRRHSFFQERTSCFLYPIAALADASRAQDGKGMWNQPYLETCCRSALHRLSLARGAGRPAGLADGPCLQRLAEGGFARTRADGRFELTEAGVRRHASEILAPAQLS